MIRYTVTATVGGKPVYQTVIAQNEYIAIGVAVERLWQLGIKFSHIDASPSSSRFMPPVFRKMHFCGKVPPTSEAN